MIDVDNGYPFAAWTVEKMDDGYNAYAYGQTRSLAIHNCQIQVREFWEGVSKHEKKLELRKKRMEIDPLTSLELI